MTITGIGGLFFRSKDPDARAEWYRKHLGVEAGHDHIWNQDEGMTIFAPFPADSDYFEDGQPFMINFRVDNLDVLTAKLESAGIEVIRKPEWETEYGNFARIHDSEGLPIELWEPPTAAPSAGPPTAP